MYEKDFIWMENRMNELIDEILKDIEVVFGRKQVISSVAGDIILEYAPKIWEAARKGLGGKDISEKPDKGKVVCFFLSASGPMMGFWDGEEWMNYQREIVHPEHWIEMPYDI